jgi:hypothetical protein
MMSRQTGEREERQMNDQELDCVLVATRTIPPERRAAFLQALGYALEHSADFGDGIVERAILATKRDLLGPPLRDTIIWR